jgi:hypothetical protein
MPALQDVKDFCANSSRMSLYDSGGGAALDEGCRDFNAICASPSRMLRTFRTDTVNNFDNT